MRIENLQDGVFAIAKQGAMARGLSDDQASAEVNENLGGWISFANTLLNDPNSEASNDADRWRYAKSGIYAAASASAVPPTK